MNSQTTQHPALDAGKIHNLALRNRYVVAPMSRASAGEDGVPTSEMAAYYARFAQGGYGLIIAEGAYTDTILAQSYGNQPGMCTDAHAHGWKATVDAVHAAGGKIILQLIHAGAVSQVVDTPHAPSPVRPDGMMLQGYGPKQGAYPVPVPLSDHQIAETKAGFVMAALRAERAGFDGVEVHCANGYLLDQFLTPETNSRTAPYGGSLQNRIRLTCEIIAEIRAVTGQDFATGVRLSQAKATQPDYFWQGGLKDAAVIFDAVHLAGAAFIHLASEIKGYTYHSRTKQGESLTKLARMRTGLPVIANGGLQDPQLARDIMSAGEADFVSVGKSALVNPDLPQKIAAGQTPVEFSFDVFSHGVSLAGQAQWQAAQIG
ncbi:hypothetical protein ACMU_03060 [Actibacterium mucosum KCTC 23349]|uniref:NADH:flavin oxidoreductase/NADH oxidase N-terminal domain-containing protein n=1 Tax=Actibacterium mucosum KCTC 23349 TaxID=1454373 RepID=A0A037ZM50_9RHOB|nr:NADH:flavin oxidoreductase [Actibacterium mucosum]KAJ57501.1 hypothetical protein ACMU_03060 [Actibacterium mucosum KCTC 23349]